MTRFQWLIENLGSALRDKASGEGCILASPEAAVAYAMSYDPTRRHRYSQWLISTYIADGFLLEDFPKARETLELFSGSFRKLPSEARDINAYHSLADLWIAVKPFASVQVVSGKQQKRDRREKAYQESILIHDGEDMTVAIPTTVDAAKWWGQGTRWCTAADNDNKFDHYNSHAPLIVIDLHDERGKIQLHASTNGFQFSDADDKPVSKDFVRRNWERLQGIMAWGARVNASGGAMRFIPDELHTRELRLAAVKRNGTALKFIPEHLRDEETCLTAIENCSWALPLVPRRMRTPEWITSAIALNGQVLQEIPVEARTYDLCSVAIETYPQALADVPKSLRTRELCLKALSSSHIVLIFVPERLLDDELCMVAVKFNGRNLKHVPLPRRTLDICIEAVKSRPDAIKNVPDELMNDVQRIIAEWPTRVPTSEPAPKWRWDSDTAYVERMTGMVGMKFDPSFDTVLVGCGA